MTRIGLAWNETEQWRSHLDDAYSLACPGRNAFSQGRTPGDQPGNNVFDSTLAHALNRFANRLQANLFPSFQDWGKFTPGNTLSLFGEDVVREVTAKCDQATAVIYSTFGATNFAQAVHEMLIDLGFGQGCMLVNPLPVGSSNVMEFVAVNPAEMAFDSGPRGVPWGIFRKHKMAAHLVQDTWPDAQSFPDGWAERVKSSRTSTSMVMLDEASYYCSKTEQWYFDILLHVDPEAKKGAPRRIVTREMKKSRWLVPRWSRNTGETRGRGPVLDALPEARSLNKAKELLLINGSLQIHPVLTYIDDGIFNPANFSLTPGSMSAVGYNTGSRGRTIEKLDLGGDLQLTQFIFEEMQMNIKKIMLDDQLPPEQGAVRSATEWSARQKELLDNIGAPYGRLYSEFIRPLIEVVLEIHQDLGVLPEDIRVDGHVFDFQITSPFAQAQNVNEVNTMAQFLELMGVVPPPEQMPEVKRQAVAGYYAKKMGLPINELVYSAKEMQANAEAELQQQEQMMAKEHAMNKDLEETKNGGQEQQVQQGAPQ